MKIHPLTPPTMVILTYLIGMVLAVLLCLLSGCGTPPYSSTGTPPPTKGEPLKYYNLGQSDAVKRQYWIARDLQKGKQKSEEVTYKPRYYTFNIQPDPQANINKVPYNITLPIVE
jgi:hypothetical protein